MNLKKLCLKNRTCYYFGDLIKFKDFDSDSFLSDEHFILIHGISYKIGLKSLLFRSKKVDEFIRVYHGRKIWFHLQQDQISYRGKMWYHLCFFCLLCGYQYRFLWSLSIEKTLTLYNVIILLCQF